MEYHKAPLPTLFSVGAVISFFRIRFGERHFGGDWHNFPELLYVEEGEHHILVDGEPFLLRAGEAILYAPNAYHIGPAPSRALVDIVSFDTDFPPLYSLCNRVLMLTAGQKRLLSDIMTEGLSSFRRTDIVEGVRGLLPVEDISPFSLMRLKNNLEVLLIDLYTKAAATPTDAASNRNNLKEQRLHFITEYLKSQLHRTLTREEVATACHISDSALKELFHEQLGCGPMTYFLALKVGEAKRLIRDSSMNFTEIAEALGFGSIHHFSKFFKTKTGLTPSEYAKAIDKR